MRAVTVRKSFYQTIFVTLFIHLAVVSFGQQSESAAKKSPALRFELTVDSDQWQLHNLEKKSFLFSGEVGLEWSVAGATPQAQNVEKLETRGQGSLAAPRRNFGLTLSDPSDPVDFGEVKGKKLNLLSMWADEGYISSRLGLLTSAAIGLIEIKSQYVELLVNGESRGLYLLTRKPKSVMKDTGTPAILRRNYGGRYEVKEMAESLSAQEAKAITNQYLEVYKQLKLKSGNELFESLKQQMDIDAYMRWMAMNSLLLNGDTADEVYFYVDPEKYQAGQIYFKISPWDFDDMFKGYHSSAINNRIFKNNPNQIIFNFEDRLDLKISEDPVLLEKFKSVMKEVITGALSQEKTDELLESIRADLMPHLNKRAIYDMSELDEAQFRYSKSHILDLIKERKATINTRRSWLLEKR